MTASDGPLFQRYIGIDYSGAETPTSSLKGLRVYASNRSGPAMEVMPPPGPKKYWTRRGVAEWLARGLAETQPTLVGIDHGFSFPMAYFKAHSLTLDWQTFLKDFQHHWPTDDDNTYVDFVRDGLDGNGNARTGNTRWRRITELRTRTAKSVFQFDVQGSVAKSTHSGLPWLLYLRRQLAGNIHFWPFDGWDIPAGKSVITEIYPSLWSRSFPREARTPDQHDAYSAVEWMRQTDGHGALALFFHPALEPEEKKTARIEGWILGVM